MYGVVPKSMWSRVNEPDDNNMCTWSLRCLLVETDNRKILIDTGLDKRTVLSGIAKHYSPEEVIGQQVCVLVNLAPRKMMGVESQGMVLMAENSEGELAFLQPDKMINNGGTIS